MAVLRDGGMTRIMTIGMISKGGNPPPVLKSVCWTAGGATGTDIRIRLAESVSNMSITF